MNRKTFKANSLIQLSAQINKFLKGGKTLHSQYLTETPYARESHTAVIEYSYKVIKRVVTKEVIKEIEVEVEPGNFYKTANSLIEFIHMTGLTPEEFSTATKYAYSTYRATFKRKTQVQIKHAKELNRVFGIPTTRALKILRREDLN